MTDAIRIEEILGFELPIAAEEPLRALLDASFPDTFAGRNYFKQLPQVRLLAWDGGSLAGQVGLDHRVINVAGTVLRILGIIDLCVDPGRRGRGVGSAILEHVERLGAAAHVDFIVAMADHHGIYETRGYRRVQPAVTKWLAIEDRQSVSLMERDLSDCFLIRPIGSTAWPAGPIDLLGYLF